MNGPISFPQLNPGDWLDQLRPWQRELIESNLKVGSTPEQVAELWLSRTGSDQTLGFGGARKAANYLESVKAELRKLVCGDDSYTELRAKIAAQWSEGYKYILSMIVAAVSAVINVAAAVLTPVIALLLEFVCRIGANAWCNSPA